MHTHLIPCALQAVSRARLDALPSSANAEQIRGALNGGTSVRLSRASDMECAELAAVAAENACTCLVKMRIARTECAALNVAVLLQGMPSLLKLT